MKILGLAPLLQRVAELKAAKKKIVLCHGHFNAIHPGHLRFLDYAKSHGDVLVIAVMAPGELPPDARGSFFDQKLRSESVAALDRVDFVYPLDCAIAEFIEKLGPDVYVKGKEFEPQRFQMGDQLTALARVGGRMVFGSGDVHYASTTLDAPNTPRERAKAFIASCQRAGVEPESLAGKVPGFEKMKLIVIGDSIVDQFVSCDVLGVSAEAPVLAIRELEARDYVGGAAIVACHVQALGGACTYVSVIGEDAPAAFLERQLTAAGVQHALLKDDSRPTTYKTRYLVENQKMLRVSRLRQHMLSAELEAQLIDEVARRLPGMNGVVISDFVYGVVTPRVLEAVSAMAQKHGVPVFGDLQCSSQTGDAGRFKNVTLITPTEKEARIAVGDFTSGVETLAARLFERTHSRNMVIKLGAAGLVAYMPRPGARGALQPFYFPALETNPVDVSGAGDALLSAMAVSMSAGENAVTAAALGTAAAAISVARVGNLPVTRAELLQRLEKLARDSGDGDSI